MKELIDKLFKDGSTISRHTKSFAQMLQSTITGTLGGGKYVNELLQNADDAKAENVQITLTDNYFIFAHDGEHFSESDVNDLCDTSKMDTAKTQDSSKTGHMDIGFKSVFAISDQVFILSDKATFRFDKYFTQWKDTHEQYPWPVVPIWTDPKEIDKEVLPHFTPKLVTFVFKIKNLKKTRQEIQQHMAQLMITSTILIFLRNIKQIQFKEVVTAKTVTNQAIKKSAAEEKDSEEITLECSDHIAKKYPSTIWFVHEHAQELSEKSIKEFENYDDRDIPKKIKNLKLASVLFATPKDRILVKENLRNNVLYARLPMHERLNLPFLVSADFIPNQERTHLRPTPGAKWWNTKIIRVIARLQFFWFAALASTKENDCWMLPLDLIATDRALALPAVLPEIKEEFHAGYTLGIKENAFIQPLLAGVPLLKVSECVIDYLQFTERFGSADEKRKLIDKAYNTEHRAILASIGARALTGEDILREIKSASFQQRLADPGFNIKVLKYLFAKCKDDPILMRGLTETAFILGSDDVVSKPAELLAPTDALGIEVVAIGIRFINEQIYQEIAKNDALRKWLIESLGMTEATLVHLIHTVNEVNDKDIALNLASIVLNLSERNVLTEKDYKELSALKLLSTKGSLVPAKQCYLGTEYQPDLDLAPIITNYDGFVAGDYLARNPDPQSWRVLFVRIQVAQIVIAGNIETIIKGLANEEEHFQFVKAWFHHLVTNHQDWRDSPLLASPKKASWPAQLRLKATNESFVEPRKTYLGDAYQPKAPIETLGANIPFVAASYMDEGDDVSDWNFFFSCLGVRQNIAVRNVELKRGYKEIQDIYDFEPAKKYLQYLKAQTYPEESGLGVQLCPSETMYWSHQHVVINFVEIEFIEHLIGTPIFWKITVDNWGIIYPHCSEASYKTQRSTRKVPSSVYFYAIESLRKQCGQDDPALLYAPTLKQLASGVLANFLDINVDLTDEQIKFFGFKTVLNPEDAIKLLKHFRTQPVTEDIRKKIGIIYHHLLQTDSAQALSEETLQGLELLTESGRFVSREAVYGFLVSETHVKTGSLSEYLMWNPKLLAVEERVTLLNEKLSTLSLQRFTKVCTLLKIKPIKSKDLQVKFEESTVLLATDFKMVLLASLPAVVTAELLNLNYTGVAVDATTVKSKLTLVYRRFMALEYLAKDKILLHFEAVFEQETRAWIDLTARRFYFRATQGNIDRITMNRIGELCKDHFKLQLGMDDLNLLLSDEVTRHEWIKDKGDIAKQTLAVAASFMTELQTLPLPDEHINMVDEQEDQAVEEKREGKSTELDFSVYEVPPYLADENDDVALCDDEKETEENRGNNTNHQLQTTSNKNKRKLDESVSSLSSKHQRTAAVIPQLNLEVLQNELKLPASTTGSQTTASTSSMSVTRSSQPRTHARTGQYVPGSLMTKEEEDSLVRIGLQGEKFIYEKLKRKYQGKPTHVGKKYKNFQETPQGFKVEIEEEGAVNVTTKEVIWLNKGKDESNRSKQDHDLVISITDEKGETTQKIVEVKGNKSGLEAFGFFPEAEYEQLANSDNYTVYHVRNLGSPGQEEWRRVKAPAQALQSKDLVITKALVSFSSLYEKPLSNNQVNHNSSSNTPAIKPILPAANNKS